MVRLLAQTLSRLWVRMNSYPLVSKQFQGIRGNPGESGDAQELGVQSSALFLLIETGFFLGFWPPQKRQKLPKIA